MKLYNNVNANKMYELPLLVSIFIDTNDQFLVYHLNTSITRFDNLDFPLRLHNPNYDNNLSILFAICKIHDKTSSILQ